MGKSKKLIWLSSLSLTCLMGLVISQAYMLFVSTKDLGSNNGKLPGSVGLRSYFDSGTGTSDDPFIITRPIHMFNLSRLQALGAFPEQEYFQVGRLINSNDAFDSSVTGGSEPNDTTKYYVYGTDTGTYLNNTILDMANYTGTSSRNTIVSIGSTAAPFYGIFDGGNSDTGSIIIKNMTIDSDPEDIGVFGYIAGGGICRNVVFSNLTITDNGYKNDLEALYNPTTAYADITGIVTANTSDIDKAGATLSLLTGGAFSDLSNTTFNLVNTASLPSSITVDGTSHAVTYSIRTTNDKVFNFTNSGNSLTLDTSLTGALASYTDFVTKSTVIGVRFYVTASVTIDNIKYAKIVTTYYLTIGHTKAAASEDDGTSSSSSSGTSSVASAPTGTFDLSVARDIATSYAHNTNIGFIAGHTDGSISKAYVYRGQFKLNQSVTTDTDTTDDNYTHQAAETTNGLVGEIGINIYNNVSPSVDYESAGDTGIINFTNIYSNVRDPAVGSTGHMTESGYTYYYFDELSTSLYDEFMRKKRNYNGTNYYYQCITDADTSIDFVGKKIISENGEHTRGLGIFTLNTTNTTTNTYNAYTNGLGEFAVTYNSAKTYNKVYYTTAELDATGGNGVGNPTTYFGANDITAWKPGATTNDYNIHYGTALPTNSRTSHFGTSQSSSSIMSNRLFERNYDYLIGLPLNSTETNYYFSDSNSGFIQDYFTYKLRDKIGDPLNYTDQDFGIMIKELKDGAYQNTTSFNSYLKVTGNSGTVTTMTGTDSDGNTALVPQKSIQFKINNEYGANITVLCSSQDSNYLCVYDSSYLSTTEGDNTIGNYPSYSMYIPSPTITDTAYSTMPYYFDYVNPTDSVAGHIAADNEVTSGVTYPYIESNGTTTSRLYAHTFYIPKAGTFFLGTPSGTVNVYYVAVQGQNGAGEISGRRTVYTGSDTISDMNFLLYDPEKNVKVPAYIYISAYFSSTGGSFIISVSNTSAVYASGDTSQLTITYDSSLTKALVENATKSTFQIGTSGSLTSISSTYYSYNWSST